LIRHAEIVARVAEWQLSHAVIEKDYVLGWLLWGIGSDPRLQDGWIFKGGTCLKKCYFETYRFSEDLDFTVLPGGPITPEQVHAVLPDVLRRVGEESGIDFSVTVPRLRSRPGGLSTEGSVYYRGPLGAFQPATVKLDLTSDENVVRPPVLRLVTHPYSDELPRPATVRCYSFDELFAEKIRAMAQRSRPRDLYDIVNLYRHRDLHPRPQLIRAVLEEKCAAKGVALPSAASLNDAGRSTALFADWEHMLAHQLPALPPAESFWSELPGLFDWLDGRQSASLPATPVGRGVERSWSPPPTITTWGGGVPLESIRFAAANRLHVDLGYNGTRRLIEPYSLRRTQDGHLLLGAVKAGTGEVRTYRVDRIQSVTITTRPFRPRFAVEFAATGPTPAPPTTRSSLRRTTASSRPKAEARYTVRCPLCHKTFRRQRPDTQLNAHKNPQGYACSGRHGHLI